MIVIGSVASTSWCGGRVRRGLVRRDPARRRPDRRGLIRSRPRASARSRHGRWRAIRVWSRRCGHEKRLKLARTAEQLPSLLQEASKKEVTYTDFLATCSAESWPPKRSGTPR